MSSERENKSAVWRHFTKLSGVKKAKCNLCEKEMPMLGVIRLGRTTTNFIPCCRGLTLMGMQYATYYALLVHLICSLPPHPLLSHCSHK